MRGETTQISPQLPTLPSEVWLRILLFSEKPSQLRLANRSLYALSQSPHAIANWLIHRYTHKKAYLGALWWWSETKTWRWWLLESTKIHSTFLEAKIRRTRRLYWMRPWLAFRPEELKKKKKKSNLYLPCPRCGSIPSRPNSGRNTLRDVKVEHKDINDEDNSPSHVTTPRQSVAEKEALIRHNDSIHDRHRPDCTLELYQLEVCMELDKRGCVQYPALNTMISFSATKRHFHLLRWILERSRPVRFAHSNGEDQDPNINGGDESNSRNTSITGADREIPHSETIDVQRYLSLQSTLSWIGAMNTLTYLLTQSIRIQDYSLLHFVTSLKLLQELRPSQLKKLYIAGAESQSVTVIAFLLEHGPTPPVAVLSHFFNRSTFAAWFKNQFSKGKMNDLCLSRILSSFRREELQEAEPLILTSVLEQGYPKALQVLVEDFGYGNIYEDDRVILFNAIVCGHLKVAKFLLQRMKEMEEREPQLNRDQQSFFKFSRLLLLGILGCDHGMLLFALISCLIAMLNALVCEVSGQGTASTTIFGLSTYDETDTTIIRNGWCLVHNYTTLPLNIPMSEQTWWKLLLTSLVFLTIYVCVYVAIPLHRILIGLYLVYRHDSQRVANRRRMSAISPEPIRIIVQ